MTKQEALQTPWYNKTVNALQLAGMSDRTQHCYARAVRMLIEYYNFRRNESKWNAATLRISYSGIKFFFQHVLEKKLAAFRVSQRQKR